MDNLCPFYTNSSPAEPPADTLKRVLSGKVQGVCFRIETQRNAKRYGLVGWVKNRADGNVEGEAQGPPSEIEKLVGHLKEGPRHAKVMGYQEADLDVKRGQEAETTFSIIRKTG
ncbi:hypothetical protein DSL72_006200 [Monilinia vaccinii-corymbosi]|uniref:Acylphosphatase n=1 Tax=Monilinia vaccinii-corymbosi TaxID=61207 RepID=A0A8A3PI16_9HELO|nr:hypothetical protein DSL72_006200 [Monilinia vaccinii-corymbosi]